jgi:hypothetical protein
MAPALGDVHGLSDNEQRQVVLRRTTPYNSDALCDGCSEVGNAGIAVDGHEQVQFCEHGGTSTARRNLNQW